jgi:hypothetical protein
LGGAGQVVVFGFEVGLFGHKPLPGMYKTDGTYGTHIFSLAMP